MTPWTLWIVALAVAAVTLVVVTGLLHAILVTAREIHGLVAGIWTGGGRIAANTTNVAHLSRTNHLAGELLRSATGIAKAAERIGKATAR